MERLRFCGLFAAALCALLTSGCGSAMGPKLPKELSAPSLVIYSQADFKADSDAYHKAVQARDLEAAKAVRNQIAYRVMADVESGYGKFEMNMTTQRAAFETGSDAVQLGITAATTLVGASDVKNMLAASLSAFQGTRLSYDKNWYREKTTEALLSQMRASRKTKQAQLILSLGTRDVNSYPLEAAWIDLVDFYYAGTVPSALVEIAASAGASAKAGADKLNDAVQALTPTTPAQAQQSFNIRAVYEKLKGEVADPAQAEGAAGMLRKLLTKAGVKLEGDETPQALLDDFNKQMILAISDDAALKALNAAIADANFK